MAMMQVRFHGRGGQGVVTAAEILSIAAFLEGRHAQAFPSFGSERMGAPVTSYCRISEKFIRSREPVTQPDLLVIQDATLLSDRSVLEGLAPQGSILLNSNRPPEQIDLARVCTVPATEIALRHVGRPLPNSALLGAIAGLTGMIRLESLVKAIRTKFPGEIGNGNAAAAEEAYKLVQASMARKAVVVQC